MPTNNKAVSEQPTAADKSKLPVQPSKLSAAVAIVPSDNKERAQKKIHVGQAAASILPRHMTKGIQINSPGPAYKVPGLKRTQGGKPLHQIQPHPS